MLDTKPKLKSILLVEDDSVDAMTVKRAMNELNVKNELVHCPTAEKALEYLQDEKNEPVCVILLDLNMPGMNGIEFLKIIKANDKHKNIPVVMLAASREERNIVETFNLGVAGYIFKPVDSKKLDEFEPIKLFLAIDRNEKTEAKGRTLICLLLLLHLIGANIGYNLWAGKQDASIQNILTANVIYDLWTKKVIASKPGTVVGIVFHKKGPCTLINQKLVYEGDTVNGVKIIKIDKSKVEFEKNGRRWTQQMLDEPNPAWNTTKSVR